MKKIDSDWIRSRLGHARGEQARLAAALGIGPDRVSKILKGERTVRPEEVPKLLAFFNVTLVDEEQARSRRELLCKLSRLNAAGQALVAKHLDDILAVPALLRDGESNEEGS